MQFQAAFEQLRHMMPPEMAPIFSDFCEQSEALIRDNNAMAMELEMLRQEVVTLRRLKQLHEERADMMRQLKQLDDKMEASHAARIAVSDEAARLRAETAAAKVRVEAAAASTEAAAARVEAATARAEAATARAEAADAAVAAIAAIAAIAAGEGEDDDENEDENEDEVAAPHE